MVGESVGQFSRWSVVARSCKSCWSSWLVVGTFGAVPSRWSVVARSCKSCWRVPVRGSFWSGRQTLWRSSGSWRRVSRRSPEAPLVGWSACHSPPRPHRDSRRNRPLPQNPVRAVGRTTRATRGTSSLDHAGGTRRLQAGKSRLPFLLGFLCKCLWVAPVCKVVLF